jgi:hypothetical protein
MGVRMSIKNHPIMIVLAGLALFLGLLCATPVAAAEQVSEDWEFSLAPYLWALSVDGNTTVNGQQSTVDMSFSDVWDNLNFAVMLQAEARKGRIGWFISPFFSQLESESNLVDIKIDLNMLEFGGYYRLGPWGLAPESDTPGKSLLVDLYAGGRYTYVEIELDGNISNLIDAEGDRDWVDPIVGLRSFWTCSPRWMLVAGADVGGFGVGSDFAWQARALISYSLALWGDDDAQLFAGYRVISQDYETGSGNGKFAWDIDLKGPLIGLQYHF